MTLEEAAKLAITRAPRMGVDSRKRPRVTTRDGGFPATALICIT